MVNVTQCNKCTGFYSKHVIDVHELFCEAPGEDIEIYKRNRYRLECLNSIISRKNDFDLEDDHFHELLAVRTAIMDHQEELRNTMS